VRADLPDGILEPVVHRVEDNGGMLVYYAITASSMTEEQLSWFVDDTVTKRLLAINGVARVRRGGGVNREIRVELDPARMQSFGITAGELNSQLRAINLNAAGGRAQLSGAEQALRVLGSALTAAELGDTEIALGGGQRVRLRDIATVTDGIAEVRGITRLDGRPAITFGIMRASTASDVDTADRVAVALDKLKQEVPSIHVEKVWAPVDYSRLAYASSIKALIEGALCAVAIVFLFLRDWRSTGIAALAIPLSAIPTFAFMHWMGFTLNQFSLLALSLVTGVLVDDAIVEIENISRHMAMGKSAWRAAMDAADEIGLAVVATSGTIIAVFLPVSFIGGYVGQYFQEFGLTVAVAVFVSLLVARLITPLVAAYALKPNPQMRTPDGPLMSWYLRALRWGVMHRVRTMVYGLVIFVLSIAGMMFLPSTFLPDSDMSLAVMNIEFPPGVPLSRTNAAATAAYEIVRKHPEVKSVVESVGEDANGELRSAELDINLVKTSERNLSSKQWQERVLKELQAIPDARISFANLNRGGGGSRDIGLFVVGSDPARAQQSAAKIVEAMRRLPELKNPRVNADLQRPELVIKPRVDEAARLGITAATISQTVRIATIGDIAQNSAKFSLSDRQIPIRVSLAESARRDISALENLPVRARTGVTVPLKTVADIGFGLGPSIIRRYDQQRRIAVDADLSGMAQQGDAIKKIYELPEVKSLPEGVQLVRTGNAEYQDELMNGFMIAMVAGVLMVFAVLVLLFARVFQPLTILSALPLSVGGAAIGLFVTNNPFSMATVIGMLMLMGIVGKNSILLVEFAIEEMRAGKPRLEALLEAGHKRARPIVMTTVAMIAGMLPAFFGIGGAQSFQGSMAAAVIGGLISSTGLTLVMVPAAFTWIDDLERWAGKYLANRVNQAPVATLSRQT
jgi:multidrug efflux pump subunit AcrB